jgi:hypothetical protein
MWEAATHYVIPTITTVYTRGNHLLKPWGFGKLVE